MERLILCGLLLGTACSLQAQTPRDTKRALREGNEAYRRHDNAKAIEEYGAAGQDPRAAFNLGNAYYAQDSFPDAQKAFEQAAALAKDPAAQARAYHNLGNSALSAKKYEEAIRSYKEALKRAPNDDDTRYNLLYAMQKLQQQKQQQNKDQKEQEKKQEKQQDQQQQKKPEPERIDKQDAMRMLDAMQQQEKNTQDRLRLKEQPKKQVPVDKDW
ncbi:MAG: tetratricopeptide repeat protein [Flavobacteriales bacterium]